MKFKLLLFFGFLATLNCFSQELIETRYFNKNWQETSSKKYQTKREIYKVNDTLFNIKDFYKGKYLEMTGSLSHLNPEIENGVFIFYDKSGKVLEEIEYSNGEPMNKYYWDGTERKVGIDYNFQLKYYEKKESQSKIDTSEIVSVEIMPTFQGNSPESFRIYIQKNLRYPKLAFKYKVHGRIKVSFTIFEDGSVGEVEIVESVNKTLDKEAARVIMNSPMWKPATAKGKPVKVKFTFPVVFALY